jgi:TRAP-type C4-dicarboxylate transport system permease small subunit
MRGGADRPAIRWGKTMKKLDKLLWRLVDAVILVAVFGMVCLIGLQVGSRLMGASIAWTEELSRFLFIWTIWMGLGTGFRNGMHPALTMLTVLAPPALQPALRLIPALASVILFSVVSYHGWGLMQQQIRFGEQSAILQVGMWLATLPLVLGSGLAILGTLIHAFTRPDYADPDLATPNPDAEMAENASQMPGNDPYSTTPQRGSKPMSEGA